MLLLLVGTRVRSGHVTDIHLYEEEETHVRSDHVTDIHL